MYRILMKGVEDWPRCQQTSRDLNLSFDGVFFTHSFFYGGGVDSIYPLFTCETNRKK